MAQRDLTKAQFRQRLKKYGFRQVLLWIDIGQGVNVGLTYNVSTGKPCYRESLRRALQRHEELAKATGQAA